MCYLIIDKHTNNRHDQTIIKLFILSYKMVYKMKKIEVKKKK